MENKEAIKYLIPPVATSTKPSAEYLKQKEAYDLAIKALEKPQVTVFAENANEEEIEDFKQELENVLEKTQCKWIPVSEKLPEVSQRYLVYTKYDEVMTDFFMGDKFIQDNDIIAWMPLPEPYKRGEEE